MYYNRYRYYRRKYAPKTDARLVVLGFIAFFTVFHYFIALQRHRSAIEYFKNHDKKFRQRVKRMAEEEYASNYNSSAKSKRSKKATREEMAKLEEKIADALSQDFQIEGGYKKPTFWDLFAVQLAMLPITTGKWVVWNLDWIYRHDVKGEELSYDEKFYLACRAMSINVDMAKSKLTPEEQHELVENQVWIPENKEKYENQKLMEKHPNLYKRYRRFLKQN